VGVAVRRYLVTLQSHAEGPCDVVYVDARAVAPLRAIANAVRDCAGMGPWAVMRAVPWPRGVSSAEDAAARAAGVR
jgi:hypothetical protein